MWAVGLVLAVLFAAGWFGSTFFTMPELGLGVRALVSVIIGAGFGVLMGLWLGRVRSGYGGIVQRPEFGRSVRRGTVPPDADVHQWRRGLEHHQRLYRWLRWAPLLYLPMTALSVWLAASGNPLFWGTAAFFLAMFVATAVTTPRVLRNTEAMLAELARRERAQDVAR